MAGAGARRGWGSALGVYSGLFAFWLLAEAAEVPIGAAAGARAGEGRLTQALEHRLVRGPSDASQRFVAATELRLAWAGLEWRGALERLEEFHSQKPHRNRYERGLEGALGVGTGPVALRLALRQREVTHPDPDAASRDREVRAFRLAASLELGALTASGALTREQQAFPNDPSRDGRLEAVELRGTWAGEGWSFGMARRWRAARFPHAPTRDEWGHALSTRWALEAGALRAVASFERSARVFPGNPTRDERGLDRALALRFPWGAAEVGLLASRADTERPNRPRLTRRFERLRGTLEREVLGGSLLLRLTQDTTRYPNDPRRDRRVREALLRLRAAGPPPRPWAPLAMELTLEHEETTYPNDPVKDRRVRRVALTLERAWPQPHPSAPSTPALTATLTLTLDAQTVRYPQAPDRDVERRRLVFELEAQILEGLSGSLEGRWAVDRYPNAPARDTTTVALGLAVTLTF